MIKLSSKRHALSFARITLPIFLTFVTCACSSQRMSSVTPKTSSSTNYVFQCEELNSINAQRALDPHNIQLVSWNIFKGNKEGWERDLYRLSDSRSVFVLQEAPKRAVETALANDPQIRDWRWQFAPGYKTRKTQTGVLTFSRGDSGQSCKLTHQEPWLRSPKASLITRYSLDGLGSELLIANIHGVNFTLGTTAYRQQLADLKRILLKHQGPLIVAGDFNSWSNRRNRAVDEVFNDLRLKQIDFEPAFRKSFFGHPLDHVFYRGLLINSKRVHKLESSDHNPIQVNFRVRPSP